MTTSQIYISPDREVLATTEVRPMFQSGITRWLLGSGRWYKLAKEEDIPPAPNRVDFIWVNVHGDVENKHFSPVFKAIPHKPQHFLTIQQWREGQIMKLNEE